MLKPKLPLTVGILQVSDSATLPPNTSPPSITKQTDMHGDSGSGSSDECHPMLVVSDANVTNKDLSQIGKTGHGNEIDNNCCPRIHIIRQMPMSTQVYLEIFMRKSLPLARSRGSED
jgi:hypothetical protein